MESTTTDLHPPVSPRSQPPAADVTVYGSGADKYAQNVREKERVLPRAPPPLPFPNLKGLQGKKAEPTHTMPKPKRKDKRLLNGALVGWIL